MKIGGACKMLTDEGQLWAGANLGTTTVKKLASLSARDRNNWLWALVDHNLTALANQVAIAAAWPKARRMWRIGSDVLPIYTHDVTQRFYNAQEVQDEIAKRLRAIGDVARAAKLRLSFHPGQFVVIGSKNPGIRENSMRELKYHCDLFTMMGYDGWHPDGIAVNIHVGVKEPAVKEMRTLLRRAPSNVRNMVTLENDEFSWCAREIVDTFGDLVPLVLDVHHYWIHQGKRLKADDPLVNDIRATWRGVRPKLHLAMSFPELCEASPKNLVLSKLLDAGNTRAKLRVHAQSPWHARCIEYTAGFDMDIMWEGGDKNLGADAIARHLKLIRS